MENLNIEQAKKIWDDAVNASNTANNFCPTKNNRDELMEYLKELYFKDIQATLKPTTTT